MPQRYAMQNGRITLVGDDTAQDHVPPAPAAATKAPTKPAKPAKPSNKPTKPQAPWWQKLPHAVVNELRWAGKQVASLDAGMKLVSGSAANPVVLGDPVYYNTKMSAKDPRAYSVGMAQSTRQIAAAVGPGAVQTAGEGLIAMGQKLLAPTQFADPRQTVPGRALNALTRASYDALGAKQPEQLTEGQRGVVDNMGRQIGIEALTLPIGGLAVKGIKAGGWAGRGLRWGTALGVSHGLNSVLQDSTQGNPLNMAFALAGKDAPKDWPGYFAPVDPIKDDRMGAAGKSILPNLLFGEALGFGASGALQVTGKVGGAAADKVADFAAKGAAKEANAAWEQWAAGGFDPNQADRIARQFTNIARWKRAARANVEHTSAWEKLEATGLVETVDGKQRFTEAARQKPAPVVQTAAEAEQALLDRYGMGQKQQPAAVDAPPPDPAAPPAAAPEPAAAPPPSQEMAMGGPVLDPEKPLPQGDPELDPWSYDPALPEVADVQKVVSNMDDDELKALAVAGADGGPVLPQIEQAMSARPAPQPRPELSEGYAGAPTTKLSELYLNGAGDLQPWSEQLNKLPATTLQEMAHPDVSPQLAQKITNATGRSWGNFTRGDILDGIKALSADGTTILPNRVRGDVRTMATDQIQAAPREFQYKEGVNKSGEQLGQSLGGVERWDPNSEGVLQVFSDSRDGITKVVNGHNRLALAKRLGIPSVRVEEVNATTPAGARSAGAISNISEGNGTPFDAAKFIKSTGLTDETQLRAAGIPLDKGWGRQGLALSKLPSELFQKAVNGDHRIGRYVALGESGLNEAQMRGAHQVLEQRPNMSEGTFRELLDDAENVPVVKPKNDGEPTLPGMEEDFIAPLMQRYELVATVKAGLSKDKRLFGFATKNADALSEAGGTTIDTAAAGQRVADASQAVAVFDTLKNVSGPVSDLLNQGLARVAQGESLPVVAKQIQREIGDSIERELANSGLKAKPEELAAIPPEPAAGAAVKLDPNANPERTARQFGRLNNGKGKWGITEQQWLDAFNRLGGVPDWFDLVGGKANWEKLMQGQEMPALEARIKTLAQTEPSAAPLTERYRQEAMQVPGAEAKDYSPQVEGPPPPDQGQIPFSDGGQLGPLFNGPEPSPEDLANGRLDPEVQALFDELEAIADSLGESATKNAQMAQRGLLESAEIADIEGRPAIDRIAPSPRPAPEPSRADLEAHAIQRAIANGEVRPSEMGPLELPAAPEADLDAALQELMGMDPSIPFEDQLPNMPAARQAAADELRLAAEHARRDAEMTWAAEQAAREAEGYHLKSLEQKKVDGLGQEWMEPGAITPSEVINPEVLPPQEAPKIADMMKAMVDEMRASDERMLRGVQEFTDTLGKGLDELEGLNEPASPRPPRKKKLSQQMGEDLNQLGQSLGAMTRTVDEMMQKQADSLNRRSAKLNAEMAEMAGLEEAADPKVLPPTRPALIAAEVSGAPPFVLPKELNKSSPRYGRKLLQFESDLDRTAYMLFNDKAKGGSKAAEKFREALTAAGFDPEQVAAHGKTVKAAIKAEARDTTSETVVVPVQQFGSDNPRLPLPDQQKEIGARQAQIEDIQRQINEGGCGT